PPPLPRGERGRGEGSRRGQDHTRRWGELLDASGYADRPQAFAELLVILDDEMRLVMPVPPAQETVAAKDHEYRLADDTVTAVAVRLWLRQRPGTVRRRPVGREAVDWEKHEEEEEEERWWLPRGRTVAAVVLALLVCGACAGLAAWKGPANMQGWW